MSRAFKSIDNQITTGGDYIEALRRKTMYMSIMRKAKTVEGANSIAKYDNDLNIQWCQDGNIINPGVPIAKLKSTINYKTLLDISKGKRQANPVLNGSTASKFNIFTGNFAMVHGNQPYPLIVPFRWDSSTQNTNVPYFYPSGSSGASPLPRANTIRFPNNGQSTNPMDASWNETMYPGWWFDPYGILTEANCIQTEATNLGIKLVNQVEIIYRWSHAYWRSVAGQSMSGFAFPESITFSTQPTNFVDDLTLKYGPLPRYDAGLGDDYDGLIVSDIGDKLANQINAQQAFQLNEWCQQQGTTAVSNHLL